MFRCIGCLEVRGLRFEAEPSVVRGWRLEAKKSAMVAFASDLKRSAPLTSNP